MLLFAGIPFDFSRTRTFGLCTLRSCCRHYVAGIYQRFFTNLPGGGTAMFAFLALAGDLGATVSPSMVGSISEMAGGNLKTGLLTATVFPVILVICLIILNGAKKRG